MTGQSGEAGQDDKNSKRAAALRENLKKRKSRKKTVKEKSGEAEKILKNNRL
jgi:hypothetical protein